MKQKIKIFQEGKYLKTVKVPKIDLGKILINKLIKKGNAIWNKLLLSLQ